MKKFKSRIIISAAVFIAIAGLVIYTINNRNSNNKISTENTVSYTNNAPNAISENDFSFDHLVDISKLVIVGEVKESIGRESIEKSNEPGSVEAALDEKQRKMGAGPLTIDRIRYVLKVKEVISGHIDEKEINLIQALMDEGNTPNLKVGEKVLLFLDTVEGEPNTFGVAHPQANYFYLDANNKVHPVYKHKDYDMFESMDIKEFKKRIQDSKTKKGKG